MASEVAGQMHKRVRNVSQRVSLGEGVSNKGTVMEKGPDVSAQISTQDVYETLPCVTDFDQMADPDRYVALPDDWAVGVADIVGSTEAIAQGRYKAVNLVGAAVISAQLNAAQMQRLPYVFGGDGAQFAVWPAQRGAAEAALDAVRRWAWEEFELELRVAMATVADIRRAGQDVRVARYAPAPDVDYASFSGGGLTWLEAEMKAGRARLSGLADRAGEAEPPDLAGLSCRWSNFQATHCTIASVVVAPQAGVEETAFAAVARAVIAVTKNATTRSHPVPEPGPKAAFSLRGMALESRIAAQGPMWWRKVKLAFEFVGIWLLFRTGRRLGGFDPKLYRADVARNADFQKFDDGLKMTLDCDPMMLEEIEDLLRAAQGRGLIHYGIHTQDEAMMTCLVPAPLERTHMHFVDGAAGGYALAAAQMKRNATGAG